MVDIRERITIKGEVEVIKRKCSPRIAHLEDKLEKEWDSGKKLLSDAERKELDEAVIQKTKVKNLTMERAIDMMICEFAGTRGMDRDQIRYTKWLGAVAEHGGGPQVFDNNQLPPRTLLYPEVIGIGGGIEPPTVDDEELDDDFNFVPVGDYTPEYITYRNTHNSKHGGWGIKQEITSGGATYNPVYNDNICQYSAIYKSNYSAAIDTEITDFGNPAYPNVLRKPIYEVGLFAPIIQTGIFHVQDAGAKNLDKIELYNWDEDHIDDDLATGNSAWTILSLAILASGTIDVSEMGFDFFFEMPILFLPSREEFTNDYVSDNLALTHSFDRTSQIVDIKEGWNDETLLLWDNIMILDQDSISDDDDNVAIMCFTPRWDSFPGGLNGLIPDPWGFAEPFEPGELLARTVLPEGFVKNVNESLTVIWRIISSRGD